MTCARVEAPDNGAPACAEPIRFDPQRLGDLGLGHLLAQHGENGQIRRGELLRLVTDNSWTDGREPPVSLRHGAHGFSKLLWRVLLAHQASGARDRGLKGKSLIREGREDDRPRRMRQREGAQAEQEAVLVGQVEIEQGHVGLQALDRRQPVAGRWNGGEDVEIAFDLEHRGETVPDSRMIVDDHDAYRVIRPAGTSGL